MPVTLDASRGENREARPLHHPALRLRQSQTVVAQRLRRSQPVPRGACSSTAGEAVSDAKSFQAGVRQFTYSEEGGALRIWINGRRFIARGGNWGFPESMLRYRAREYDAAVRYHRDMNFTMIRNWVGQTGDEAFYDACDRYGIVVWQDFWLANPVGRPEPGRQRHVPAQRAGITCCASATIPPSACTSAATKASRRKPHRRRHPRHRWPNCIPACTTFPARPTSVGKRPRPLSPCSRRSSTSQQRATPKLHSELGMPNVVTMDSLHADDAREDRCGRRTTSGGCTISPRRARRTARPSRAHDRQELRRRQQCRGLGELAQFVNYDGYRAMFEAQSKNRMGLLIWMSHPCWPSLRVADLRLLLRTHGRLLRRQEGLRAAAYPVESGHRRRGGGQLQRRRRDAA